MTPRRVYVFTLSVSLLLTFAMVFLFYSGHSLSTRHAPMIDAVIDIKLEVTTAHLWFEEIMSGDKGESIDLVWESLDEAEWYANAMLEGNESDEGTFYPLTDEHMRSKLRFVRSKVLEFRALAVKRYQHGLDYPGSLSDDQLDAVYNALIGAAKEVKGLIHQLIQQELNYFRWLGFGLILSSSILAFFLSRFLYVRELKKEILFADLAQAKIKIEGNNKRLSYLAHFDQLTGLPNRMAFEMTLDNQIHSANEKGLALALLFVDLDHFKAVNDRYGHQQGDNLLKMAAQRFKDCVRKDDAVVRISGDEFVVILSDLPNEEMAYQVAGNICEKIIKRIEQPFQLDHNEALVTVSIGVSMYPKDTANPELLMQQADNAMYHAKSLGKNTYQYHHIDTSNMMQDRLRMKAELAKAIQQDEFILHFHPQWTLRSGKVNGLEVLVRWQHPEKGLVYPDNFIGESEACGLIFQLDMLIFKKSMAQLKLWQKAGFQMNRLAINISSISFQQVTFVSRIKELLDEFDITGDALEIEIIESVLIENSAHSQETLLALNELGIHMAIDDFGTGYSSMSYLQNFSMQTLKIDRSFIAKCLDDSVSAVILNNMVQLGNALKMNIVAEGIETQEQQDSLIAMGCEFGQGYLLTTPLSADKVEVFLDKMV